MVTVTVFPATTVVGLAEMVRTGWAAAGAATATQIAAAASAIVAVLASVRRRLRRGRSMVVDKVGSLQSAPAAGVSDLLCKRWAVSLALVA